MTLKLITFDVTGTLLLLRLSVGNVYAKVGLRHGINANEEKLSENFYKVFKSLLIQHPNFGYGVIGWEQWWKQLVLYTFQSSMNNTINPSTLDKISQDLIEIYKTKACWKLREGALSLLERLKVNNVKLGVISNYDPRLNNILTDVAIKDYFEFVLTSFDAGYEKPDVRIFKLVETMNKDIKKHEILHIGDSPKLDFVAAKEAGWNALLITEDSSKVIKNFPEIGNDWILKDLHDVYETLVNRKMLPS